MLSGPREADAGAALYVDDPSPLTRYEPDHPYYMAMYDLAEFG